ncbi:MAG: hypothetical protein ACI4WX_08590 [Aristaeellaceae bacterium]
MKKILSLVLALSMMLALVPAASAETDWSKEEKFTINWTQYFVAPSAEDAVIIKLLEDKFNVDINVLPIEDGNFMEVLNTYLLDPDAPDAPDVMRLKDPAVFTTYVDQGSVGAFDMELVKEHFPIYYNAMMNFQDGKFLTYGSVDGEQYGLPAIAAGNQFHLPCVYNQTWMENVGVTETPKTLDELHDLMYKFAKEDPDKNGKDDTYGLSSDGMRQVFGAFGINPGAPDGRTDHSAFSVINGEFQYDATSERYKEALKVLRAWYQEGLIDPEFITGENTGGYWALSHSMINHRIGMTVRANYYHWVQAGDYQYKNEAGELVDCEAGANGKEFAAANPGERLIFGDPVVGPYGDSGLKSWTLLSQIYAFSPELVENEAKFIRVLEIMNFMAGKSTVNDPATIKAWYEEVYGEEGKYWYAEDYEGKIFGLTAKFWEDYPADAPVNKYGREEWGPTLPEPQVGAGPAFAYSLGLDEHGHSTLLQFSLPKMAEYQTNLTNLKDNWMVNFITGAKDIDKDWDEYIKAMNKSGLKEMFEEAKAYYESSTK